MAFERPLLHEVIERVEGDLEARLPTANARLKTNLLSILARMQSGVAHELYGAIAWLAENLLPDTRDEDIFLQWADLYGITRLSAAFATGKVDFTGLGSIPKGTLLVSAAGHQYQTIEEIDAPGSVSIEAILAGSASNLLAGSLTLLSPIAGVDGKAEIDANGILGGAEQESVEAWQGRLLRRLQDPPRGGSKADYERWARAAHPAVSHAWVSSHEDGIIGLVTVRLATYGDIAGDFPAPDGQVISAVEEYINSRRSVAGLLQVLPPNPQPVDMTIALQPNLQSLRDQVQESLQQLFYDEAEPAYIDVISNELQGEILLSRVMQAIGLTAGVEDYQLNFVDSLKPVSVGDILTLGTITFEEL